MRTRARRRLTAIAVALSASALALAPSPGAAEEPARAAAVGGAGFDGDPGTTQRVNEGHPTYAAAEISRLRFADARDDGRHAAHVVLSRDDTFADSIAGSGLTGDGPLLLTATKRLDAPTAEEIRRVLPAGGRIYLLGGTSAISTGVEQALRDAGYDVRRLAGTTRIGTALAVADAVRARTPGDDVLLARSDAGAGNPTAAWADSVTGGGLAARRDTPILITPAAGLHPDVAAWLHRDAPARTTLLGGTAALSEQVEAAAPNPVRISGVDRTATAAAVARELWGTPTSGARRFVVSSGSSPSGWSYGFAAAGLAADAAAPVLLVTSEVTAPTAQLVSTCGAPQVDLTVVGDGGVVPAALREQLDAADGYACGPGGALVYPTELDAFPACSTALDYFRGAASERVGPYGLDGFGGTIAIDRDGAAPESTAPVADDGSAGGGTSGTNVQEAGVDEPDIVKTDGRHAFVVAQGRLQVVALDGPSRRLVSTLALPEDGSHELLLSGDRLLVVTRTFQWRVEPVLEASSSAPAPGSSTTTLTHVDVSDRSQPRIVSRLVVDGDYRSARLIGSTARVVIQSESGALPFTFPQDGTPEAEQEAAAHNRAVVAASTLDDWLPAYVLEDPAGNRLAEGQLVGCANVHQPPLYSGLGTLSVVTLDVAGSGQPTSSAAVVASGEAVYASTSRLFVSTGRWDWEPGALGSVVTTEVHGFDIADPAATRYVGSGAVPGYVLNQFSMSEHAGFLRIATTTEPPWREDGAAGDSESGVYVLTEQEGRLVPVGQVTGLGRGERIFAVRYFGDLAAVVTFRQVDPLYLLDLSDPAAPRVTGELKISGYSAYLHRVAPDRLLGVGSDATEDGMITGAQVSLFDIGDVTAPRLVDRVSYPGGHTAVEYDHHAFLHWPASGLAVVPLEVHDTDRSTFSGAVGLQIGSTSVHEVGRATHRDDAGEGFHAAITRSFVADGSLFTVSDAGIEAHDLATLRSTGWVAF